MIKRDNLRNKYSKNLFTEAKLNDSRKPLYIYQNLIGTSHSISDSMSYIFSARPLFAGAFFRCSFSAGQLTQWDWYTVLSDDVPGSLCFCNWFMSPCGTPASSLCPFLFIQSVMRLSYFRRFYGAASMLCLFLNWNFSAFVVVSIGFQSNT